MPSRRKRSSQPYGWDTAVNGTVSHIYGRAHDYDYYSQGWIAPDGRYFEEGYYDENGQHYNNIVVEGATTMLKCAYCGNRMVYAWAEGALPTCERCGAQFEVEITDRAQPEGAAGNDGGDAGEKASPARSRSKNIIVVFFVILLFVYAQLKAFTRLREIARSYADTRETEDAGYESGYQSGNGSGSTPEKVSDSIYVEEIGRMCYLDGMDWYDSETKCWFWYNNETAPYQWQYWYEDISSDYGDYGWMEYDMGEDAWYVEAAEGEWIPLPQQYDTSDLWHMTDEYVNAYE